MLQVPFCVRLNIFIDVGGREHVQYAHVKH